MTAEAAVSNFQGSFGASVPIDITIEISQGFTTFGTNTSATQQATVNNVVFTAPSTTQMITTSSGEYELFTDVSATRNSVGTSTANSYVEMEFTFALPEGVTSARGGIGGAGSLNALVSGAGMMGGVTYTGFGSSSLVVTDLDGSVTTLSVDQTENGQFGEGAGLSGISFELTTSDPVKTVKVRVESFARAVAVPEPSGLLFLSFAFLGFGGRQWWSRCLSKSST